MGDDNVYLGVWTNWSNSTVMGSTLTTTRQDGDLLIAFTGFLIPFVASRFWMTFCLIFHRWYSTSEPRDAIHHQRQVILRNSSSPDSGLVSLFRLFWAWRHSSNSGTKPYSRIVPMIIFASCCIFAYTAAGAFSSRISTAAGDVVLIKSDQCGISYISKGSIDTTSKSYSMRSQKLNDAANYAQQCYNNSSKILDCNKFVVPSLPTAAMDYNSSCPFQDGICRSSNNIRLDTGYLDSNDHLGLNTPPDQRLASRYVLQCAPLITKGKYSAQVTMENKTWMGYNYGKLVSETRNNSTNNFTYVMEDLDSQYYQTAGKLQGTISGFNYRMSVVSSETFQGIPSTNNSAFIPSPELIRPDGDVSLIFLSGNGVFFLEAMDDDWYRATSRVSSEHFFQEADPTQKYPAYMPAEAASPMGCVEQWQLCNSAYSREDGCGPLASFQDSLYGAAPFFNLTSEDLAPDHPASTETMATLLIWSSLLQTSYGVDMESVLTKLGAESLSSQSLLLSGVQYSLPDNQWQLDVVNWWNTRLAFTQAAYVDTALGSTDPDLQKSEYKPLNSREAKLCDSQKIRSTSYASFNVFALLFTYITSALIIILSFILEPILVCLQTRRKYKEYASLEWTTNQTLQLHRLAQEEILVGAWSDCDKAVPITKAGDILASLDITDLKHPAFARPVSIAEKEVKNNPGRGSLEQGSENQAGTMIVVDNLLITTIETLTDEDSPGSQVFMDDDTMQDNMSSVSNDTPYGVARAVAW